MKRVKRSAVKILAAAVLMALFCVTSVFADEEDTTRFVKGTDINGIDIGGLTVEEAKVQISNAGAADFKFTVKEKGGRTEIINGTEIGYAAVVPDGLQEILDQQNATGRLFGPHAKTSYKMELSGAYDEAALTSRIRALACISGADIVRTQDAHISAYQEGQPFTIVPEIQGNDVDADKVENLLKEAVRNGYKEINLPDWDCYIKVKVTSGDAQLKQLCDTMNRFKDVSITYTFGDSSTVLPGTTISTWITGAENGQIGVNRDMAAAYVASLAAQFDTAGTTRTFHTTSGRDVQLTGPYGWRLNQAAETDALIAMVQTAQSQTREPQYAKSAASRSGSDWGDTYVEIDLTGQHVYMYQNGTQVWDAPCVTGNVSKDYTTPPGIYSLTYKETDRILRGKKMPDGTYEYESHVDYWMPFNGGIGLHDANWRSKFGGTIYQYSGSHGCVNLPPAKGKALYELVYTGIPVICYN